MRLPPTNYEHTVQTIIIVPLTLSPLCLLLLVRQGVYTVNLRAFCFHKLIGKLTAFLQLQEFSLRNLPVDSSTSAARRSPHSSSLRSATFSPGKAAALRIVLNIDGAPIASQSHTRPSHSQTYTSAYVSIRQHTSASVSIRQHPSAYVSIRQHTSAITLSNLSSINLGFSF